MKWFSENEEHILAECDKCKRVLRIPRMRCGPTALGFIVKPAAQCPCGKISDRIDRGSQAEPVKLVETTRVISAEKSKLSEKNGKDNVIENQEKKARIVKTLISRLQSDFEGERIEAAHSLGELCGEEVIEPLLFALRIETRQAAMESIAEALGRIGVGSMDVLISSLTEGIQEGGRMREMIKDSLPFIRKSLIKLGSIDHMRISELILWLSKNY